MATFVAKREREKAGAGKRERRASGPRGRTYRSEVISFYLSSTWARERRRGAACACRPWGGIKGATKSAGRDCEGPRTKGLLSSDQYREGPSLLSFKWDRPISRGSCITQESTPFSRLRRRFIGHQNLLFEKTLNGPKLLQAESERRH